MTASESSIRILFVDDDPDLADLAVMFLEQEDERFAIETAGDARAGLARLAETSIDCIVSDYEMPGPTGIEFLREVRRESPDLPFILYTGRGSEEVASEAISAGVTDYLQKQVGTGQYTILANRIGNAVDAHRAARRAERTKTLLDHTETLADVGGWEIDVTSGPPYRGIQTDGLYRIHELPPDASLHLAEGLDYVHPDDRDHVQALVDRLLEEGEPFETEGRLITGRGNVRWAHTVGMPVVDDGRVVKYRGAMVDITERKRREQELESAKARLQQHRDYTDAMLDAIPDVFYVLDRQGRFQRWNESLRRIGGYDDDEIADMTASDFVAPRHREAVEAAIEEVFETGKSRIQAPVRTKAGTTLSYEFNAVRVVDPQGRPRLAGVGRDLTERRAYERNLEAIVENTTQPIYIKDREGIYRFANRAVAEVFDLPLNEILGKTDEDLFDDGSIDDIREADRRVLEEGETVSQESETSIDGERHVFLDSKHPYRDERGEIIGVMGISREITEHKAREVARRHRQIEEFAHTFAHELRNSLNIAITNLALARQECDSDRLDPVARSHARMASVIEDIVARARGGPSPESPPARP